MITATFATFVILLRCALEVHWWNFIVHIGIWGSMCVYAVISTVDANYLEYIPQYFGAQWTMVNMLSFWCMFFLMCVLVLMPDFTIKFLHRNLWPEDWHIMQERFYARMVPVSTKSRKLTSREIPNII